MSQTHCHSCALTASLFAATPSEVHLPALGRHLRLSESQGWLARTPVLVPIWPYSEEFGPVWMSTKYGDPALAWKTTAKQHPNPKRSLARSGDVHSNQLLAVLSMNSAGSRAANLEQQFFKDLSCKLQGMSHERPKKTATACIEK